jgi:hypothetical protein
MLNMNRKVQILPWLKELIDTIIPSDENEDYRIGYITHFAQEANYGRKSFNDLA